MTGSGAATGTTAGATTPTASTARRGRLVGVDVARAVAIVGMFAIHFNLAGGGGGDIAIRPVTTGIVAGPMAVVVGFVFVSGLSLTLFMSRGTASDATVRTRLLARAVVLLPLGLALQELDPDGISVVLQNFGVLFGVAVLFVGLRPAALLAGGIAAMVLGPLLHVAVEAARPELFPTITRLVANPVETVHGLLLTGAYPVVVLLGPFLLGMWLGHLDLHDERRRRSWLLGGIAVGMFFSVAHLAVRSGVDLSDPLWVRSVTDITIDSKSPLWLWNGFAWQLAMLAAALILAERLPRLLEPLAAMGRASLSVYVLHVLVIAADPEAMRTTSLVGAASRAVVGAALGCLIALGFQRVWRRGPLEAAMARLWSDPRPAPNADRH